MMKLYLLEDNIRRIDQMHTVCQAHGGVILGLANTAPAAISELAMMHAMVDLICLDHDLEESKEPDCGDGRDVVRWLVDHGITTPVLLHTTNQACGSQMEQALNDAGIRCHWVPPYDDLAWIAGAWIGWAQRLTQGTA